VAINHVTGGREGLDVVDLAQQFECHVGAGRVVILPWDRHVAAGAEIVFDQLNGPFRRQITALAAAVSDGFPSPHTFDSQSAPRSEPRAPRTAL
jgi:MinD-like ATPase involved in chromosome partitioning or flagellar assembly